MLYHKVEQNYDCAINIGKAYFTVAHNCLGLCWSSSVVHCCNKMQPEPRRSMRRNRTQEALMAAWGFRTSAFAVYGERSHSCTFHTQCFYYRQMRPKPINDWVSSLQCSFQSLFSLNQNVFSGAVGHNDVCQLISCSPDIRTTLFLQTTVLVQPEVFFLSQIARKVGQPLFSFIYVHL